MARREGYYKEYYRANKEKILSRRKESGYLAQYYTNNKEIFLEKAKEWKSANPEKVKESGRKRYKKKADHIKAISKTRQRRVRLATPPWVKTKEIAGFYKMAQRVSECTGIPHVVDHIIPIKHKLLCGLNVPTNLRVIPAIINSRKQNKLLEELL